MKKLLIFLTLLLAINTASAVIINSVVVDTFAPGQEGLVRLEVENILNDDVKDVSLTLTFQDIPFIPIGTSEQSVDEIDEDDEEDFLFKIKAAADIRPGDYEIPYTIEYKINSEKIIREGTIGVKVKANPDLSFTVDTNQAVKGKQGKITFKVINKGFYDARFVSITIIPEGYTLLSENEVYIGTVDSDDFETESFDVMFNSVDADLIAIIEYKDFDNKLVTENVDIPLTVYSQEKALQLGITQPSKTTSYVLTVVAIILLIIIWRIIKKRRRLKKSMNNKR